MTPQGKRAVAQMRFGGYTNHGIAKALAWRLSPPKIVLSGAVIPVDTSG